jgi:hypothetical protein
VSSKSLMAKRDQRTQYVPVYILMFFIAIQMGVILLLVAQSFAGIYQQVILAISILLLVVGGFFPLVYLIWKIYIYP